MGGKNSVHRILADKQGFVLRLLALQARLVLQRTGPIKESWVPGSSAQPLGYQLESSVRSFCHPQVRETVKTCALAHQVPQALAGCVALGVLSAAVGKGLVVRSASTRVTGANLFIVVGAGSGAGKSETFADLASPLIEFESQQNLDWCTDQIRRKAEGHVLEVKIRGLDRRLFRTR